MEVGRPFLRAVCNVLHVCALKEYLEVLGINSISELHDGTSQPPLDNPQVFLGVIGAPVEDKELPQYKKPAWHCH